VKNPLETLEDIVFYGVFALALLTVFWLALRGCIIFRSTIFWDRFYMKTFVALMVVSTSIQISMAYVKRPEYRFSEWRILLKGILIMNLSTILDLLDEVVTLGEYGMLPTLKIPPLAGSLFMTIGVYLWIKKISSREITLTHISYVGATIVVTLLMLAIAVVNVNGRYSNPSYSSFLHDILPEIGILAVVTVWTLALFTRGSDNWLIQLIIDLFRLSGMFLIIVLSLYILEDLYVCSTLSLFFLKKSFEIVALGVLVIALVWSASLPVTFLASATTVHTKVSRDRSVLLEVDLPADAASMIKNIIKTREYCTVIFTKKKSPLKEKLKEEDLPVLFCYLDSVSYPREISTKEYEVSAEQAHIIYLLKKIRDRCHLPILIVFDNLTDLITERGLRKTYLIAREILSFLEEKDRALFILIKEVHSGTEKALLYSLFEKIISL